MSKNTELKSKKYILFRITNMVNGKTFIGTTSKSISDRCSNGKGFVTCTSFYKDIKLYGWDNFKVEILFTRNKPFNKYFVKDQRNKNKSYTEGYNRKRGRTKRIIMMKDNIKIKEFESLSDAAHYIGGSNSNISNCCSNRIKSAFKFNWKYAEEK